MGPDEFFESMKKSEYGLQVACREYFGPKKSLYAVQPKGKKIPSPGKLFGSWTVISEAAPIRYGKYFRPRWLCRCSCGKTTRPILVTSLVNDKVTSCRKCLIGPAGNISKLPEYGIWLKMKSRCLNPQDKAYKYYGKRKIKVCDRWMIFEFFYADMGPRPSLRHTIDREDNDGNYEPANCRWATWRQQAQNRSNNIEIEFRGQRLCVSEWARRVGISRWTIEARLRLGWSPEKTLTVPADCAANAPKGSASPNSKLTENGVIEMRRLHRETGAGHSRIARMFGVSKRTARSAILGISWKHVPVHSASSFPGGRS